MKSKSMICYGVAACAAGFLTSAPVGALQLEEERIEEIVITASPHGKRLADAPASVTVLGGERLRRSMGDTLGGALGAQPGVHSRSFGPGVGEPTIRGHNGYRTELLRNGSSSGDVSDTSDDHAVAIEPNLAHRIEIVRGPAALRYGPGAVGGVINVIERPLDVCAPDGFSGMLEARYNDNNDGTVDIVDFDYGDGDWGLHMGNVWRDGNDIDIPGLARLEDDDEHGAHEEEENTDGFVGNSAVQGRSHDVGVFKKMDDACGRLGGRFLKSHYGVPSGGHGHGHGGGDVEVRIELTQRTWEGEFERDIDGDFWRTLRVQANSAGYAHREIERTLNEAGVVVDKEVATRYDNDEIGMRGEATWQSGAWLGAWGLQYHQRDFEASGGEAFIRDNRSRDLGLFALAETKIGDWQLELGARWDSRELKSGDANYDSRDDVINLSVGLSMPFGERQRLGLFVSHTERPPAAPELLSNGVHAGTNSHDTGDRGLDDEAALNLEFGWRYLGDNWEARASVYHNDFDNYLYQSDTDKRFSDDKGICSTDVMDFGKSGATPEERKEEFEESPRCLQYDEASAEFSGAEVEAVYRRDDWNLRLWADTLRARFDGGGNVPRIAPDRFGVAWTRETGRWLVNLSWTHAFKQDRIGENEDEHLRTDSYDRLDAYVRYRLGVDSRDALFLRIDNLDDEEIRNATSFLRDVAPEPGRSVIVGYRARW